MVFFNGEVYCLIIDLTLALCTVGRMTIPFIFYIRLKTSFEGTSYAISQCLQRILITLMILGPISAQVYGFSQVYLYAHDSPTDTVCASSFNYPAVIVPYVTVDFTIIYVLVYLFSHRLIQMLRLANKMHQVRYIRIKLKFELFNFVSFCVLN